MPSRPTLHASTCVQLQTVRIISMCSKQAGWVPAPMHPARRLCTLQPQRSRRAALAPRSVRVGPSIQQRAQQEKLVLLDGPDQRPIWRGSRLLGNDTKSTCPGAGSEYCAVWRAAAGGTRISLLISHPNRQLAKVLLGLSLRPLMLRLFILRLLPFSSATIASGSAGAASGGSWRARRRSGAGRGRGAKPGGRPAGC